MARNWYKQNQNPIIKPKWEMIESINRLITYGTYGKPSEQVVALSHARRGYMRVPIYSFRMTFESRVLTLAFESQTVSTTANARLDQLANLYSIILR